MCIQISGKTLKPQIPSYEKTLGGEPEKFRMVRFEEKRISYFVDYLLKNEKL